MIRYFSYSRIFIVSDQFSKYDHSKSIGNMDPQNQLVINPVPNQNSDVNFINSDDEPVPITVVLRIRPYYNSSNGSVENGNNKCLYPVNAQEISSNFQNDNCFNSIIYRNSKSNSNPSYNRGEDGSPSVAITQ